MGQTLPHKKGEQTSQTNGVKWKHKRACDQNACKPTNKGMILFILFNFFQRFGISQCQRRTTSLRDKGKWKHNRAWGQKPSKPIDKGLSESPFYIFWKGQALPLEHPQELSHGHRFPCSHVHTWALQKGNMHKNACSRFPNSGKMQHNKRIHQHEQKWG